MSYADMFNSMQQKAEQSSNTVGSGYDPNFNYGTPVATTTPSTVTSPAAQYPNMSGAELQYVLDKANLLNKGGANVTFNPENIAAGQWNPTNVYENMRLAGLTPEEHYKKYGTAEGLSWGQSAADAYTPDVQDILQPGLVPTSSSSSGLPSWATSDLLKNLIPELVSSFNDMPSQIDEWTDKNLAASHSASKNLLDGHLTTLLADLSKRGMLGGEGSSVSSDAIANMGSQVASDQAANDLAISSNGAAQKFQVPGLLSSIAGLGKTSTSENSNPLAPYELYSQMLLGMM
jgi:hypothetical protein